MQFKQEFLKGDAEVRDEYRTPDWVFSPLNKVFGFTIDVAATSGNTWVEDCFFTLDDDGLSQNWGIELPSGETHVIFNNPPFSDGQYGDWINKACLEHANNGLTIAQVLPFKPETDAFGGVWEHAKYLILPPRRIAFDFPDGTRTPGSTFFSCVAIFTYRNLLGLDTMTELLKVGRVLDLSTGLHNP